MNLCDTENRHLVVRDILYDAGVTRIYVVSMITEMRRTVPGDCYCTRCGQAVAFWFNGMGEPFAATFQMGESS
jgi:hypothetical protein